MNISPASEAFLRGLGMVVLTGILTFIGNQANLPFLNPQTGLIVSGFALWLEGLIENKTGKALFGAVQH